MTKQYSKIGRPFILIVASILFTLCSLLFLGVPGAQALSMERANNKYGIHLATPDHQDFMRAARLVNSESGAWGYITLVIQENDHDISKWQNAFDELRRLKLIPIVRLATKPEGDNWARPKHQDIDSWIEFLNKLNWVVKDRYILLFNEVNHGREWGGAVDAAGYAKIATEFAKRLNEASGDYFVMLAGLDAAAPSNAPHFEDEAVFLKQVLEASPNIFDHIDGWSSHSYPNHGYVGTPQDRGRNTIRTYEWELEYLRQLGIAKELPVFITETGWPHREAQGSTSQNYYSSDVLGVYTRQAYEETWLIDDRVRAVTPFILNYQGEPFLSFSWVKPGGDAVYPHFEEIAKLPKEAGEPEIIEKSTLMFEAPKELLVKSVYHFEITLKNEGQAILSKDRGYVFELSGVDPRSYLFDDLDEIEPGEEQVINLYLKTDDAEEDVRAAVRLTNEQGEVVTEKVWGFAKRPLPRLRALITLFPKLNPTVEDIELQVFNDRQQVVYKKKGLRLANGKLDIDEVQNIALGPEYRVVILIPYYLPRQKHISFQEGLNTIKMEWFLPLDFNKDGRFSLGDIGSLISHPSRLLMLFPFGG